MMELIPAWLGILYGALTVLVAGGPVAAVIYRSFTGRLEKVEGLALKHEHALFGVLGNNGMRSELKELDTRVHKQRGDILAIKGLRRLEDQE